jgi:hypothetical protein
VNNETEVSDALSISRVAECSSGDVFGAGIGRWQGSAARGEAEDRGRDEDVDAAPYTVGRPGSAGDMEQFDYNTIGTTQ